MNNITNYLFSKQDIKYKDFLAKLVPNIDSCNIIGVRTKEIRDYAKIKKHGEKQPNKIESTLIIRLIDAKIKQLQDYLKPMDKN